MQVKLRDIQNAANILKNIVSNTSLEYSRTYSLISNNQIYLKCENFQKTGSFKIRGAYNRMVNLTPEEKKRGVITASAGNHAQGVAYAASILGIKAVIVMPEFTPVAKLMAVKGYGAEVELYGDVYDDAFNRAQELKSENNMNFIHAFDDPLVIAGQGTIGIEMLECRNDLDIIIAPIGGGGLISGIAVAAKAIKPDIKIIGIETAGFDAMKRSVMHGGIEIVDTSATIAEGIAVRKPGNIPFELIKGLVDDILTVTEDEIASTILMLMERSKIIAEGAGAAALAAVLDKKIKANGKNIGVVISGGNIDINLISMIIEKGLIKSGRRIVIKTILRDKPGQLRDLADLLATSKVNILSILQNRDRADLDIGFVEADMVIETRDKEHSEELLKMMRANGYKIL